MLIASRVPTNIRELEGCLTRVVAYSSITKRPIDVELAREVLKDIPETAASRVTIDVILSAVAESTGVSVNEIDRRQAIPPGRGEPTRRHVPSPGTHRLAACPKSASASVTATTPQSFTRSTRSPSSCEKTARCTTGSRDSLPRSRAPDDSFVHTPLSKTAGKTVYERRPPFRSAGYRWPHLPLAHFFSTAFSRLP